MKKFVLAAALTGFAASAFAGGPSDPIIEKPIIETATAGSSSGIILPLILLALVVAAAAD